jgi:hypothetical protein
MENDTSVGSTCGEDLGSGELCVIPPLFARPEGLFPVAGSVADWRVANGLSTLDDLSTAVFRVYVYKAAQEGVQDVIADMDG